MLYNRVDNIKSSFKLSLKATHEICEAINTPRSLAVSLCLQYQEWEEYLNLPLDPSKYLEPQHFAEDYQATEILRKCPDIPLGIDRDAVALDSFIESELCCYYTNERLRSETPEWYFKLRRNISKLLGPLSTTALQEIEEQFRFGPGASTGVRGVGSSASMKFDNELHLTADLIPFSRSILGPVWWEHQAGTRKVVEGNRFTTVPKSWKTNRGICVEPTLNMFVQLGIGTYLRRRLKRFGINLNSQDRNRELAQKAYSRHLATIDLSAASDSLSSELILQYFPVDWVELLALPRSHRCTIPTGEVLELEKWSSMGNGYTFELESLVFYAVCMTIVPFDRMQDCSVYGDDIIVPADYADELIDALKFLGFRVNNQKSYLAGNFFESCGHDYFEGVNVRPFYLKGRKDKIPYSVQIANKLRLWSRQLTHEVCCDRRFESPWRNLVRVSPRIWKRTGVPIHAGDTGLIKSFDEVKPPRARDQIDAWVYQSITMAPVYRRRKTLGVLLSHYARLGLHKTSYESKNELLVRWYHSIIRDTLVEKLPTYGREPVRGYLGRPRPRSSLTKYWTRGLEWSQW